MIFSRASSVASYISMIVLMLRIAGLRETMLSRNSRNVTRVGPTARSPDKARGRDSSATFLGASHHSFENCGRCNQDTSGIL
ncbi:hypothetical protein BKA63DRAFT_120399 [Paraphoma chrysanthemicola]|nr:hypothetical protein BKA63DRAFT_120399 [Paraphoma chrysanthemicola]